MHLKNLFVLHVEEDTEPAYHWTQAHLHYCSVNQVVLSLNITLILCQNYVQTRVRN